MKNPFISAAKMVKAGNQIVLVSGESNVKEHRDGEMVKVKGEMFVFEVMLDNGEAGEITLDSGPGDNVWTRLAAVSEDVAETTWLLRSQRHGWRNHSVLGRSRSSHQDDHLGTCPLPDDRQRCGHQDEVTFWRRSGADTWTCW